VSTYDRGAFHPVENPIGQFHVYSIEWTPAAINWIIDDVVVRTLTYEDAKGGSAFPQTPMQIKLGTWCAGSPDAAEGSKFIQAHTMETKANKSSQLCNGLVA
jgi:beta-glucanase (GH16 family)